MLKELTLWGETDKVKKSIERLRMFEPPNGYYLAFSGGKDSIVIHQLALEAGVKFKAYYNVTTVDPPEMVYYIRDNYPNVTFNRPELSMWQLIVKKKFPPTSRVRYCCSYLKENTGSGKGEMVMTGVRWAESARRKNTREFAEVWNSSSKEGIISLNDNDINRRFTESCIKNNKIIINPIIDWSDEDVWEFITLRNLKYCSLYDEGFTRIGCIGCPLASLRKREFEFKRYPKYFDSYLRTFDRMLKHRKELGLKTSWKNADEVMHYWMYGRDIVKKDKRQLELII